MPFEHPGKERREFLRYRYDKEMRFDSLDPSRKDLHTGFNDAISKNVSASGLLFTVKGKNIPVISSLIVLDLDYRTAEICKEIESNIAMVDNKLLGRVVRIDDNEDGTYGIGVAFIKKSDRIPGGTGMIEEIIKKN